MKQDSYLGLKARETNNPNFFLGFGMKLQLKAFGKTFQNTDIEAPHFL